MSIGGARLRARMVGTMVLTVTGTVLLGYLGVEAVTAAQSEALIASLPAELLEAQRLINQGIPPDAATLGRLVTEARRLEVELDRLVVLDVLGLALASAIAGAAIGAAQARRIAAPLDQVATALRRVAQGEFSARAGASPSATREVARLVGDFNTMAGALEALDRELREGSAAIAHELRTPLTILRGRLQGMRDGVFATGPRELDGLIRQVDGLARIVEDLRTVGLAATGHLELRRGPMDLAADVDALARTMAPEFAAAGMAVELDLRPAPLVADAARLRQAALALLDNARRHAAAGGQVRVEVSRPARDAGGQVVLRVMDRGPGLPPGAAARVFDRFWRADGSRSREHGGSGLGLSVVRAIVEAHGGTVAAADRPGGGALFEARLPG